MWGTLYDIGGDARVNGIPFDEYRTEPWKLGWGNDLRREAMSESDMQAELERRCPTSSQTRADECEL